jgi:hypothetical protein
MTQLAVIHAGPAAETLKMLVRALDCVGVRENYFMTDLIETLRYNEDFEIELKSLTVELLYGQYFHKQLADRLEYNLDTNHQDSASTFLFTTAKVAERVAEYLHENLVAQSRYDHNGKFPYEYHSFDGKLIYLRPT